MNTTTLHLGLDVHKDSIAIARKLVLLTMLNGATDVDATLDGLVSEALAKCGRDACQAARSRN